MQGPDHSDVARDWGNLANALRSQGDDAGALQAFQNALAIQENKLGPWHPIVGTTINNMSGLLQDMGKSSDALQVLDRAVIIAKRNQAPDAYVTALANKAILQFETGDIHAAIETATGGLEISREKLGMQHPKTQHLANITFRMVNERARRLPPPGRDRRRS